MKQEGRNEKAESQTFLISVQKHLSGLPQELHVSFSRAAKRCKGSYEHEHVAMELDVDVMEAALARGLSRTNAASRDGFCW